MKRAAIVFTPLLVSGDVRGRLAQPASADAQVDLIARLTPVDVSKLATKGASVHQDLPSKALTFTFSYAEGEPEVRIPVRQLGWPTDWRAWRSVQYTFVTTSVETISIGFSDGKVTKAFITVSHSPGEGTAWPIARQCDRYARNSLSCSRPARTCAAISWVRHARWQVEYAYRQAQARMKSNTPRRTVSETVWRTGPATSLRVMATCLSESPAESCSGPGNS